MIALLTIHYHSPEALCIRSDGAREGAGGDEGRGQGRAMKRKREKERVGFWRVFVCWRARGKAI